MCNTTTTTRTTTRTNKPTCRSLHWLAKLDNGNGIVEMRLTFEKRTEIHRYFLTRLPSDYGVAYRLEKIGDDASVEGGERYDVNVSARPTCECKGFLRWGHCKHVDACTAITARETKPTTTPTTKPVTKPAIPHDWQRCEAPIV